MSKKRKHKKHKGPQAKSQIPDLKSPTLSLCMIVKDEEEFLPNCLNSVKGIVDEMIVVDTGSSDRTVEIAEEFGARVLSHPFSGDFSEARNVSISEASSDWILVLDADEEIDQEDAPKIRKLIQKEKADGIYFTIQNMNKNKRLSSIHYLLRLFRNGKGILYERRIHELIAIKGKTVFSSLRINHFGYYLDRDRMITKYRRDLDILEGEIQRDPDDLITKFYLARTYFNLDRCDDAMIYAESMTKTMDNDGRYTALHLSALRLLVDIYMKKGELDEASTVCQQALEIHPDHMDILFVLAQILTKRGEYGLAVLTYQRYLSSREKIIKDPSQGFLFRTLYSFGKEAKVYNELGGIFFKMKNFQGAIAEVKKAIECDPACVSSYLNLGAACASTGRLQEAVQAFQMALEIDPQCIKAEEGLKRLEHCH